MPPPKAPADRKGRRMSCNPLRLLIAGLILAGAAGCAAGAGDPAASASPAPQRATRDGRPGPVDVSHFPTERTTGVRPGVYLRKVKETTIYEAGAVLENVEVRGKLNIEADDVTVRNVRIIGEGDWAVIQRQGHSGLTLENVEIAGDGTTKVDTAVLNQGGMVTIRRANIHTVSNGVSTEHGLIEDSYLHDFTEFEGDHVDGVQSAGSPMKGLSLILRHNTILNQVAQTSAVILGQDFSRVHSVVIENNLLAGGGYTIYGGQGKFGTPTDVRIVDNVFSTRFFPKGGHFGPVSYFDAKGRGNLWEGNVWERSGGPVRP
jgi:hypothetical protein